MDMTVQIPQKMKVRPNTQALLSSSAIFHKNIFSAFTADCMGTARLSGQAEAASGQRRKRRCSSAGNIDLQLHCTVGNHMIAIVENCLCS